MNYYSSSPQIDSAGDETDDEVWSDAEYGSHTTDTINSLNNLIATSNSNHISPTSRNRQVNRLSEPPSHNWIMNNHPSLLLLPGNNRHSNRLSAASASGDVYHSALEMHPLYDNEETGLTSSDASQTTRSAGANSTNNNQLPSTSDEGVKMRRGSDSSDYMTDGKRRIDYILAYTIDEDDDKEEQDKKALKRKTYLENLTSLINDDSKVNELLEIEEMVSEDGKTHFVKVHAPLDTCCYKAEEMRIRMPIKENLDRNSLNFVGVDIGRMLPRKLSEALSDFEKFIARHNPCENSAEMPKDKLFYTAPFDNDRRELFLNHDSEDDFFPHTVRSRIVYDILIRTKYDKENDCRIGIGRLIRNGSFVAAYPLHEKLMSHHALGWRFSFSFMDNLKRIAKEYSPKRDGGLDDEDLAASKERDKKTVRQILYEHWAKPSRFFKYQPLGTIRVYFGEKIALYFAWLGFYTKALIPASVFGVICVIYGYGSVSTDIPSLDICDDRGNQTIYLCPNCDHGCKYTELWKSCIYAKMIHVFDNFSTVIFAMIMSLWATLFLEGWKREHAKIAWDWKLTEIEIEEEPIRPDYQTGVRETQRVNPITGKQEPFLPWRRRLFRLIAAWTTVLFFLLLVLVFVFGVIVYRVIVVHILYQKEFPNATMATTATGAILNLVCIMALNQVYTKLALKLTKWEYPRTDTEFENSYTLKVFLFQFVNFYSSLFYIAFFKGKFMALPGTTDSKKSQLFGYPPEQCDPAGCMNELVIQLMIIMVGKQLFNNFLEICFPIMLNWWRSRSSKDASKDHNPLTQWEKDYNLTEVPENYLVEEFLEMVLQFGFVTLFVAAFPLAPLFALFNNIIEIRLDAYKYAVAYRRPRPQLVRGLGVWDVILDSVSKIAVFTNACVIAFTSDFVPRMLYMATEGDGSLKGYTNWTMSYYPVEWFKETSPELTQFNQTFCRYREFRRPPCVPPFADKDGCDNDLSYTFTWWHVFAAKLAFILIFEHSVFLIKGMLAYLVPDVPENIVVQQKRELYLAKMAKASFEINAKREKREKQLRESRQNSLTNITVDQLPYDFKKYSS